MMLSGLMCSGVQRQESVFDMPRLRTVVLRDYLV